MENQSLNSILIRKNPLLVARTPLQNKNKTQHNLPQLLMVQHTFHNSVLHEISHKTIEYGMKHLPRHLHIVEYFLPGSIRAGLGGWADRVGAPRRMEIAPFSRTWN